MGFSYADQIRGESCRQLLGLIKHTNKRMDALAKEVKTLDEHLRVLEESRKLAEQFCLFAGLVSTDMKIAPTKKKKVRIVYKDMDPIKELR